MKLLMVKCHQKTLFSWLQPIQTEPYELEILASVAESSGTAYRIFDALFAKESFQHVLQQETPDVLLLSGYITAVDTMLAYARIARMTNPDLVIVAGGVHASLCPEDFMVPAIDLVVHSDGARVLKQLIDTGFHRNAWPSMKGLAYWNDGKWVTNPAMTTPGNSLPSANRSYFHQHKQHTRYLHHSPVALLQTALSCPHSCNFCYCRHLNNGVYAPRPMDCVIQEISQIPCDTIWIIDDTFLIERKRVEAFMKGLAAAGIHKQFIAYARADFLAEHADLVPKLKQAGFVEFIIGLESQNPEELASYDKKCTAMENQQAVQRLQEQGIQVTGLFIAHIHYTPEDFRDLRRWMNTLQLNTYTLSIYTPMKGLPGYEEVQSHLTTHDPKKWDFLHLVMDPTGMSRFRFYCEVWYTYAQQLGHNKILRQFIISSLVRIFKSRTATLKNTFLQKVIRKESSL